jgi:hypothetical protein
MYGSTVANIIWLSLVKYAAFGRDEILIVDITMCLQIYHNGPRSVIVGTTMCLQIYHNGPRSVIVGITMCLQIYHNGPRSGLPYLNLTTTPQNERVSLSTTLEHVEQLYGFEPWELSPLSCNILLSRSYICHFFITLLCNFFCFLRIKFYQLNVEITQLFFVDNIIFYNYK